MSKYSKQKINKTYKSIQYIDTDAMKKIFIDINNDQYTGTQLYKKLPSIDKNNFPFFIIKYGPPSSGKGSKNVQDEIEKLGVDINTCIVFEVDRIIESLLNYRTETYKIYKNYTNHKLSKENVFNKTSDIYMDKRAGIRRENKERMMDKMDRILEEAIKDRKNIIFETTGGIYKQENPIQWILNLIDTIEKKNKIINKYKRIIIYPVVSDNELLRRASQRAEKQIKRNPPFFRGISKNDLIQQIKNSKQNFSTHMIDLLFLGKIDKIIAFKNE